jgi:hypothetical protein
MPSSQRPASERDTYRTIARFVSRLFILVFFAAFSTNGFGEALVGMLALATIYCAVAAVVRREATFGPSLGHMDEAAGYTLVGLALLRLA